VAGWQVGPFIQDDWRILPNLTINLGLRWDPNTPPVSQGGRGAAWVPGASTVASYSNSTPGQQSTVFPNAPAGLVFPGDPGPSHEEKAKAQRAVLTRGIQEYR
jgi:hypothetical protein